MKKKLESELVSIAHRILKLKGKEDVIKMHTETAELYEKLSVLKFFHEHFEDDIPEIGSDSSFFGMLDNAFNNKISDNIEVEDKLYINLDDAEHDAIMEPGIETIKDMVAQMPHETHQVDQVIENIVTKPSSKTQDLDELTQGFKDMPIFEPVSKLNRPSTEKQSLNHKISSGRLTIGLNDKIAFTKHLFNGNAEDYNRVISQINTFESFSEAENFIDNLVKPDYNAWQNNEELEKRFLQIIESKFE